MTETYNELSKWLAIVLFQSIVAALSNLIFAFFMPRVAWILKKKKKKKSQP